MRKLLRYALACAMTMISTASMATTVGNEDNTTGWWSAFSDYYTIAPNQTLTLEFTNYSNKAANWFNYMTVVTTDADRGATDYSEYIVYRADCYGWQYGMNTAENPELYKYKVDNFGDAFADFTNIMDGAKVVLTVKRINESVSIIADITSTGGAKYRSFYAMNCGDGSQTIRAFLTTENGHLVIDDNKTTIADTDMPSTEGTVVGELDNATPWWTAFSDYYTIQPNETKTIEFENYSCKVQSYHNWLLGVTSDADRGSSTEYFMLRADNYGWGSAYDGANLSSNYNWDVFKDDMDGATVKMTITREGSTVTANADITAKNGNTYFEKLTAECGDGSQPIRAFVFTEGGHLLIKDAVNSINSVQQSAENNKSLRYNLAGQRVDEAYKGIVIENGKKYLVK